MKHSYSQMNPDFRKTSATDPLNWLLGDHLGSTSMVANASGVMVSEVRYSAFGETRYDSGTMTTDYLYTGQRQEAEIGLYYYVARWYDPAIGRFIQADSVVPDPGLVLGYDRFAYGINNPIRYTDPTGHWFCEGSQPCEPWVEYSLNILNTQGGEEANKALRAFYAADNPGSEVKFNFSSPGSGMNVTLYVKTEFKPLNIDIGDQINIRGVDITSGKKPDLGKIALLAHEFTHVGQSPDLALSVIGELLAYEVQYQVTLELIGRPPRDQNLLDIHEFVTTHDIYSVSPLEQEEGRREIVDMCPSCRYEKLPYFPGDIKLAPPNMNIGGPSFDSRRSPYLFE